MSRDTRREYDASIGRFRNWFGQNASNSGYSLWNGPLRPQALFVDQNACIGIIIFHSLMTAFWSLNLESSS